MGFKGMVIAGPSGCGKSLLAKVLASELKMNFIAIKSTDLLSKYYGQSEMMIRDIFTTARSVTPCALFFDDFDTLAYRRSADMGDASSNIQSRILSTFLNELDGIVGLGASSDRSNSGSSSSRRDDGNESRVLVIIACQSIDRLDEALIRPGWLYYHVGLGKPTNKDISELISHYSSRYSFAYDVSFDRAKEMLRVRGSSCADVTSSSIIHYGVLSENMLHYIVMIK